jgi:uncharacterized Fe-S cluster-containing protein
VSCRQTKEKIAENVQMNSHPYCQTQAFQKTRYKYESFFKCTVKISKETWLQTVLDSVYNLVHGSPRFQNEMKYTSEWYILGDKLSVVEGKVTHNLRED